MPSYTLIRDDAGHKEDTTTGDIEVLIAKVGEYAERDKPKDLDKEEVEKEVEAVVEEAEPEVEKEVEAAV